jgi:NADPH-dependent ferric siderophore reductase
MARALPRKLSVLHKEFVSTNMLRITLTGDDLSTLGQAQEGGYLKLHFVRPDCLNENIEAQILSEEPSLRPILRTYTIRHQRYNPNQIDIDFVVHDTGPASSWANKCALGDCIYVAGPGKIKQLDPQANWYFLVGDMTALPAISVNIEGLPSDAKGYAVIEILHENDKQILQAPADFEVIWVQKNLLINEDDLEQNTLIKKVKQLKKLPGEPSFWLACEFNSMRNLRQYFLKDLDIDKRALYASSYWKKGVSEDEHKKIKALDAKAA